MKNKCHYNLKQMVLFATFLALIFILDTITNIFLKPITTIPIIHQKCLLIAAIPLMLMLLLMPLSYSGWGLISVMIYQYGRYHFFQDLRQYYGMNLERTGFSYTKWHSINILFHIIGPYSSYCFLLLVKTQGHLKRYRWQGVIIIMILVQTLFKTINGCLLYLPAIIDFTNDHYKPYIILIIFGLQLLAHLIHHLVCGPCVYYLYHKLRHYYRCHFITKR